MLIRILAILAALAVLRFLLLEFERANLYAPEKDILHTPALVNAPYEDLMLKTEDGVLIHGWHVPASPRKQNGLTLLFCHGNGGNISYRLDTLLLFRKLGLDTLLFDYRGYGKSEGRPSELGTYRDALAAYRYLTREKKVPPERMVLFGESLGGAVAVELATRVPIRALILFGTITSTVDIGKEIYPFLPVRWIVRNRYDSLRKISRIQVPLLLMHSREDEIILFHHGEKLFRAAREPKQMLVLAGGHNDYLLKNVDLMEKELEAFFLSLRR